MFHILAAIQSISTEEASEDWYSGERRVSLERLRMRLLAERTIEWSVEMDAAAASRSCSFLHHQGVPSIQEFHRLCESVYYFPSERVFSIVDPAKSSFSCCDRRRTAIPTPRLRASPSRAAVGADPLLLLLLLVPARLLLRSRSPRTAGTFLCDGRVYSLEMFGLLFKYNIK